MNIIQLSNMGYAIPLIAGIVVAFFAFLGLLSFDEWQKTAIRTTAIIGCLGVVVAITFGTLFGVQHNQAIQVAKAEVQRVYNITLIDQQATDLLSDKVVQLNDGSRIELRQKSDGTYKLVQPVAPRDVPLGSNLAAK